MVVAGLQVACEAHIQGGKVLGHPPPEKIRNLVNLIYTVYTSDFLCRLPATSYLPSTPVSLSCLCNSSCALLSIRFTTV